jgi:CRP-like cAMP-binding protein
LNALQHLQTINVLEHFQNARHVVSIPAGQAIFHEGERGTVMYVLLEGMVDVSIGGLMVELAQPGTLLGEMALVDGTERSATAIARSDCRLVSIDARQFDLLVQETPAFARHVMRVIAERLRRMNERLREAFAELTVH